MIDINDKFNVCSTINYYNIRHIKDNIDEVEAKGNYFLANISARYPCINFSRTQWVKNNNRPNDSEELKMVLAWPSSHYSNYPWLFFVFMGNLVAHDAMKSLIYLCFIYTLLFFL